MNATRARGGTFPRGGSAPGPGAVAPAGAGIKSPIPGAREIVIGPREAGLRIDLALARLCPQESRSSLQRWIREGFVRLEGAAVKPGLKVRAGSRIRLAPPPPKRSEAIPEEIPLEVLYEDDDLLVVNKPAGMVTHPGPGNPSGTLVNALLHRCPVLSGIGGVARPGIVHRLDKGTSGIMVAAKNDMAHRSLSSQFKGRKVTKTYLAVVWRDVAAEKGRIDLPIGRDRKERKKISPRTDRPRQAATGYRVIKRLGGFTLLEAYPETGRTHQIRVHLAHLGHPVVGDAAYGSLRKGKAPAPWGERLAAVRRTLLHAYRLSFRHPRDGRLMEFTAGPPPDFESFIAENAHAR